MRYRRASVALVAAAVAVAATTAAPGCGDESRRDRERRQELASFDHVWTKIRDRHFDRSLSGLDWDAVRAELRPRVQAARSRDEARAVMRELVARLHVSHVAIVGPRPGQPTTVDEIGTVGVELRPLDGGVVVVAVDPDGSAARAGVAPGWTVEAVAGRPVAELLAEVRAAHAGSSLLPIEEISELLTGVDGKRGTSVDLRFRDGDGRVVERQVERLAPSYAVTSIGNLAGVPVGLERRSLADDTVIYLRVTSFFDPARIMPGFRAALADAGERRGLVLDLRGNSGGIVTLAAGMCGYLVADVVTLGTTTSLDGEQRTICHPQADVYGGPLAVLVDELSASTSEVLAGGLQDLGRARLFGRRTAGAALPSLIERLPDGDLFQRPTGDYVSSSGRRLEGVGVVPDQIVALDRADLLAGRDAPLDAALAWIAAQPATTEETAP